MQHHDSTGFRLNCERFGKNHEKTAIPPRWRDACHRSHGIMTRRCLRLLSLIAASLAGAVPPVTAESLVDTVPHFCQVRTTDYRIAAAVAFLMSDDAAWITGHVIAVDGGQVTRP